MCDKTIRLPRPFRPGRAPGGVACGLLAALALALPQRAWADGWPAELPLTRTTPAGPQAPQAPHMADFADLEEVDAPQAPQAFAPSQPESPALRPANAGTSERAAQASASHVLGAVLAAAAKAQAPAPARATAPASTPKPVVMLDAGHGGEQTGAQGICGVWEKEVTLEVSLRVAAILEASKLVVPMLTRTDDTHVPLEARSERANRAGAQLLVSIHANASPYEQAHGIETFFLSLHAASKRLAKLAQRENDGARMSRSRSQDPLRRVLEGLNFDANHSASQALAMRLQHSLTAQVAGRGRGVLQAPFRVLMGAQMPATLVEIGFITHPTECARLTTPCGQQFVAQGIAAGILAFLADVKSQAEQGPRDRNGQGPGLQSLVNAL